MHRHWVDKVIFIAEDNKTIYYRVIDLVDVWFDSGAMPYAQQHFPFENKELFAQNYPADFIAEGVDQTRGWFYTLHAIGSLIKESVIEELEKVNLPQLEERLIKITEENKFKKLQFQSPDMGRHVTVEFSIQDASTRTEKESKKLIVKILQEHIVKTNWRLVSPDNIHYRLGIISGKLKAHETEEDLLMLAKKIKESTKN